MINAMEKEIKIVEQGKGTQNGEMAGAAMF